MSTTETTRRGKRFRDLVNEAKTRITEVQQDELRQWLAQGKDLVIIDVRPTDRYEEGHVEGAINVPRGGLEINIDDIVPDQDKVIVTCCGGGSHSALSAETLETMGYCHVYSLAGGWKQWKQQNQ